MFSSCPIFAQVSPPVKAATALKVYDELRRSHTKHDFDANHSIGDLIMERDEEMGLDSKKMEEALAHRCDFIMDLNNKKNQGDAMEMSEKEILE